MSSTAYMPNLNATINNGTILGNLTISGTGPSGGLTQNRMYTQWTYTMNSLYSLTGVLTNTVIQLPFTSQVTGTYTTYLGVTGATGWSSTQTGPTGPGTFFTNTSSAPQNWIVTANSSITNLSTSALKCQLKVSQNSSLGIGFPTFIPTGYVSTVGTITPLLVQPGDQIGVQAFLAGPASSTGAQLQGGSLFIMQV
jgi:hypothetical protein